MKHATNRVRGKRCSTFRDYGCRVAAEPYPRHLAFSSTYNFRDVGGYPVVTPTQAPFIEDDWDLRYMVRKDGTNVRADAGATTDDGGATPEDGGATD